METMTTNLNLTTPCCNAEIFVEEDGYFSNGKKVKFECMECANAWEPDGTLIPRDKGARFY